MVNYITASETPDGIMFIDSRPPRNNTVHIKSLTFEPLVYHGYEVSFEVVAREILNTLHSFQLSNADVTLDGHR